MDTGFVRIDWQDGPRAEGWCADCGLQGARMLAYARVRLQPGAHEVALCGRHLRALARALGAAITRAEGLEKGDLCG